VILLEASIITSRMWKFDPEEVIVPVGSAIDIYVSTQM
jgi:hypothetical protein